MKYKFYYDLHWGADNALNVLHWDWSDQSVILGGDIYDLANCKKSEVEKWDAQCHVAKTMLGNRFQTGNHERCGDFDDLHYLTTKTGFMHGDLIFWGREKSDAYRDKPRGAGIFKRKLWVNALDAIENGYNRKVSNQDLERFYQACLHYGVNRIIVGHLHPDKQLEIDYKGKRLTVLKRGLTEMEL